MVITPNTILCGGLSFLHYLVSKSGSSFAPVSVKIGVNSICNARCKTCDIGTHTEDTTYYNNLNLNKQELDYNLAVKAIDSVALYRPKIMLNYTEPLLYRPIFDLIRHVKKRKMTCMVQTNGLMLGKYSKEIINSKLDHLGLSIDGTAKVHDEIRGVPGMYNKIFTGLREIDEIKKRLSLAKPRITITYVISEHSQNSMLKFVKDLADMDVTIQNVIFSHQSFISQEMADEHNKIWKEMLPVTPTNCFKADPTAVNVGSLVNSISAIDRLKTPFKINWMPYLKDETSIRKFYRNHLSIIGNSKCMAPWFMISIRPDGSTNLISRCFNVSFGNIADHSLIDIFNSEGLRKFRRLLRREDHLPACSRCCAIL